MSPQTYLGLDASGNPTGDWITINPGKTGTMTCSTCTKILGVGNGAGLSGSGGTVTTTLWGLSGTGSTILGYPPLTNPDPGGGEGPFPGGPLPVWPDPFPVNPPGSPVNPIPINPIPGDPVYSNAPPTSGTNGIIWPGGPPGTNIVTVDQMGFGAIYSAINEENRDVVAAIQKFNQDNNRSLLNTTNFFGVPLRSLIANAVGISNGVSSIDGNLLVVTNYLGQIYARQAVVGNGASNALYQLVATGSNQFVVMSEILNTNVLDLDLINSNLLRMVMQNTNLLYTITNGSGTNFDYTSAISQGNLAAQTAYADYDSVIGNLGSVNVSPVSGNGAMMITIGQTQYNWNPLANSMWAAWASWAHAAFVWLWSFGYVYGCHKVTRMYVSGALHAPQAHAQGGGALPGVNTAIGFISATVISTVVASLPGLFIFYLEGDIAKVLSLAWHNAGGNASIQMGIGWFDTIMAGDVCILDALLLLWYSLIVGKVYFAVCSTIRYITA